MDHRKALIVIACKWLRLISDAEAEEWGDEYLEEHFRFFVRGQPPGGMGLRHRLERAGP